ncbi:hydrolase [Natronococcus wangiae]|uniref:hydrolase n=1 Tax=Natronococcus wangiae TaxID=3068275 RepID=UPI00273E6C96|nr:hydrolase [Natronococcus sp. AD5]
MTIADWAADTAERIRNDPVNGTSESLYELYLGGLRRTNALYSGGEHVYGRNWDALILLDACRVDLLEEVADEYSFLDDPGTLTSVGSSSIQWLERTFTDEYADEMRETAYVTGNPFSKRVLSDDDLLALDEVWRYGWDEEAGTIPARPVTDRAIAAGREHDYGRLVVHYMQPHFPSVPDPLTDGMNAETLGDGEGWDSPWHRLRRGELDRDALWSSYRENLRYVLRDVALLLENLDADRVVISADHGNTAGEWGVYGHPKVPLEPIRNVPWYETSATDTERYVPERESRTERGDLEEKLGALGYL